MRVGLISAFTLTSAIRYFLAHNLNPNHNRTFLKWTVKEYDYEYDYDYELSNVLSNNWIKCLNL